MKDPIKIIHKFKNNNRRIQYKIFIFIGAILSDEIIKILNSIKNKDFYNSLIYISNKQYKLIEDYYGKNWYEFFFISYHINSQIKIINNSPIKKKELENKYGKEWFNIHINNKIIQKISYSFAASYYDNLKDKKKILDIKKIDLDYRSTNIENNKLLKNIKGGMLDKNIMDMTDSMIDMTDSVKDMTGGMIDMDDDIDDIIDLTDDNIKSNKQHNNDDIDDLDENIILDEEILDELVEEDFDLDELTKLYNNESLETDNNIKQTSKLISEAIHDKKWEKKIDDINMKYDNVFDNIAYDSKLEDSYNKYYITDEYIFKDDTIKTMRHKITISIPLSDVFGKIKLLPENQYLWSEYYNKKEKESIMIGHKWIRRNELLKIDIIPNENLKVYEKLRNNLGYLKDYFGHKIKREDDENNIVRFYEPYMTNNEIYMLDIYNELGINYNVDLESKKNLYDVYISIYYPYIFYDKYESIISLLNGSTNEKELIYINSNFNQIKNDSKLLNLIYNIVEEGKLNITKYDYLFSENHIIQSNIHVNISNPKNITGTSSDTKFNLYRIFDSFIVNKDYPFIQYQTSDGQITYKFYTKTEKIDDQEILSKWFENAPYGISFKILLENNKYISINLQESGRIEYKITWKEDDNATIETIVETYNYIKNILKKINSENKKIKFIIPDNDRFNYAFINTIQKFTIPEKFIINHNDLSEFCRFFFPYISLVIEPKKRKSMKNDDKEITSKFGTYLRYKRISKYDNRIKVHLRILYFIRNYDINDRELIDEIAKQFNITNETAIQELNYVREKYSSVIKKSNKSLKKLKSLPKSIKPPGIGIDIQGRDREKYKIRITGARNKEQLIEIIDFMKVLIYLYIETYLYKKKDYQKIKDTLKSLSKIASRRNKVSDVVNYEQSSTTVKTITSLDKKRLGFKPEKGQNQWTRSCQNSGNDKQRRPDIFSGDNLEKLVKAGYKLNDKTGFYEKKVELTIKKNKKIVTIRAIKLPGENNSVNFYTCDPSKNQEHMYIGFLARGNNPNDLCMPCCFKKDQLYAHNKVKKNYYLKCIGEQSQQVNQQESNNNLGDKIYILQETNKIQDGRFIYLPKYLDIFFNKLWNHDNKIKNHYLYESKSGYFFKYTTKHDYYNFLIVIANIFNITIETIINYMITFLEKDKNDIYFTYLNNGDIKETFKTREVYIEYIKTSQYLEYDIIGELISLPSVLSPNGLYFFIFEKNNLIIKKALDKNIIEERYYLNCLNKENNYMINDNRDYIILIKDAKYYFPIYRVQKDENKHKKIKLETYFNDNNKETKNIIDELKKYNYNNCQINLLNKITGNSLLFTKNIINQYNKLHEYIVHQYIDERNKCKYIYLKNKLLLPVYPSGISYNYKFYNIKEITDLLSLKSNITELKVINKILNLDYIPKTVFYDSKNKNIINIISILLENNLIVPIKSEKILISEINNLGLSTRFQPLEETINKYIVNYNKNNIDNIDSRHTRVKTHIYKNESYNIYRLELSLFLETNKEIKNNLINIVRNNNISIIEKKNELRKVLFKIISPKLIKKLNEITSQKGNGKIETMANLEKDLPNVDNYNITNFREYCYINKNKENCNNNVHCSWANNECKFRLDENMAIDFVNKVLEEMIQDSIQFKELLQEGTYYVSDIVDYNQYSYRINQKIIKSSNYNIEKIMSELFGKNKAPIIGKRQLKINNKNNEIIDELPKVIELGKQLIQIIIPNKDSIIRAFVNSYYWINNTLFDNETRNLGYYSELQSTITNLFKVKIIDFIQNIKNNNKYEKYLSKYFKSNTNFFDSALNKFRKQSYNTDGKLELYILSFLLDYRIVVYNNYNNVQYLFLQGEIEVNEETIKQFTSNEFKKNTIFIKLDYDGSQTIPKNIYSIYYK